MTRDEMRTFIRTLLGVDSDDQLFTDTRLDILLEQAHAGLVGELQKIAPEYFNKTVTLTYSGTNNEYALTGQAADFAELLELRITSATGQELSQTTIEQLGATSGNKFAVVDRDEVAKIYTSSDVTGTSNLWMRYSYWPAALTTNTTPAGVPEKFHEVVPLEAIFVFEIGNEQQIPQGLRDRWQARKASFFNHAVQRVRAPTKADDLTTREGMRSFMRTVLGVRDDDRAYTDARLNMLLKSAHLGLVQDIYETNPTYYEAIATLAAEAATGDDSHRYVFGNQGAPITNLAHLVEVREDDDEGVNFREVRSSELYDSGAYVFSVSDQETDGLTLRTSPHFTDNGVVWIRYVYWPTILSADGSVPDGVPTQFADVIALEALMLIGDVSPNTGQRWVDRRGQLMSHVSRLSSSPRSRVRSVEDSVDLDFTR